ncbi:MAG TPA: hypothetical protein VJ831_09405 [Jatrophihabitantaceae bacterium]|nr:hypothetical protein [Jatrophihabitantaceae bacterium]
MTHIPRSAGIGLAVYGLGTAIAFASSGTPGGNYDESAVTKYISFHHFWLAAGLWYLSALCALALLVVASGLRSQPRVGRFLAGLATTATSISVAGAFVSGGLAVAMAEGGTSVRNGVPHQTVYVIAEVGNLLAVCAPALCVGVAAIVLAVRSAVLPGWLRVFSIIAGICGVLAPFYFTYFVFVLWTVVAGTVLARRRVDSGSTPSPAPSLV